MDATLMEYFHLGYYVTTGIALTLPAIYYFRTKNIMSFGVMFPLFFCVYSFVGPLAIIHPDVLDQVIHRHHCLWHVYPFRDAPYVYLTHLYLLLFYAAWFFGYHRSCPLSVAADDISRAAGSTFSRNGVPSAMAVLAIAASLVVLCFAMLYLRHGTVFVSPYSAHETDVNKGVVDASTSLVLSFAGVALVCFLAVAIVSRRQHSPSLAFTQWGLFGGLAIGYLTILVFVGDRSLLLMVLVSAVGVVSLLLRRIVLSWRVVGTVVLFLLSMTLIDTLRGSNPGEYARVLAQGDLWNIDVFVQSILTGESFSAYSSMLFVVGTDMPLLWGRSFLWAVLSFVPRGLAPWRPETSFFYSEYAGRAGILDDVSGLTCHYVADWYANFAIPGVVLGGVITGWLMGALEKKAKTQGRIYWAVVYVLVLGYLPILLRGGIEGWRVLGYVVLGGPFLGIVLPRVWCRLMGPREYAAPNEVGNGEDVK